MQETTEEPNKNLPFEYVLTRLKNGRKISREGWNGKGMFVYYVPANAYSTVTDVARKEFGEKVRYNPYLAIKNVDGTVSTWVPSINDVLAEDWCVLD